MKNLISKVIFNLPDTLEDIFPLVEMEEKIGKEDTDHVFQAVKSINELVLIDEENDTSHFVDSNFTAQVLGSSLKIIESNTKERPEYILKVIEMFHISDYLTIPERLKTPFIKE